ncbi:MAG: type II secretion system protein GspD [Candidatus Kryptoniota bacterium]
MKNFILVFLAALSCTTGLKAQINTAPKELRHDYVSPQQMVTIVATTPFNLAIGILDGYSRKFLNKIIIDPNNKVTPIGVDIDRMQWLDALEAILRANGLWYKEYESYIQITPGQQEQVSAKEGPKEVALPPGTPTLKSREVNIEAVFFEADISKLNSDGININYIIQGTWNNISPFNNGGSPTPNVIVSPGATVTGIGSAATVAVPGQVNLSASYNINNFGTLSALFGVLESENFGKVLASPNITVRSGEEGHVQVGQNFFVTTKDFAGNTVQQMFNTGIIITVTPTVYTQDSVNFVSLDLQLTNSSLSGSAQTSEVINTEEAKTKVLLLNGEQTVIGGLYSTSTTNEREGIPVLKDLPWWVFGIRYLTGSDNNTVQTKELIILLRATLLPTLRERDSQYARPGFSEKSFQEQLQKLVNQIQQHDQQSGK